MIKICAIKFEKLLPVLGGIATTCALCAIVSCSGGPPREIDSPKYGNDYFKEDFEDHTYIVRAGNIDGYGSGMAHDPNCQCNSPMGVSIAPSLPTKEKSADMERR